MKKIFICIIFAGTILLLPWMIVSLGSQGRIYDTINTIPARKYGLLLWTTPGRNQSNPFFTTRIEATKILFENKKIEYIVVSGDNSSDNYNEPFYMKTALERAGIPSEKIITDNKGFRTLDSVLRAKEVFSLTDDLTIISQPFHLERAIFLAKRHKINAIGYSAANVSIRYGFTTYIREIGARWLALFDAITGRETADISENNPLENK